MQDFSSFFQAHNPWLAPLAGWSDLPFRLLCRERGAEVTCSEMVSVKGLVYGGKNTADLLATCPEETSLILQVFGAEAEFMEKGIEILQEKGFRHFDVNVGCSVHKVVKTGAGAAMLKDIPNLLKVAEAVINTTKNFSDGRIGFKLRLGYEMNNNVYENLAKELEALGADWLTLHPRYAKQSFSGVPDYSALKILKDAVQIPIVASGDLFTAHDGVRVIREYGVDTVMYARGAMSNPFIFEEHRALMDHIKENPHCESLPPIERLLPRSEDDIRHNLSTLIQQHLAYTTKYCPHTSMLKMRTIVPRYVKNLEGAKQIRQALIACTSYEELNRILDDFFRR